MRQRKRLQEMREQILAHRVGFVVYMVLRIIVVAMLVFAVLRKEYESAFTCALSLVLFLLPSLLEKRLGLELPSVLQVIILLFIFAAMILGELQNYYELYPHWDTLLHTTNGFLCAAIGFSLVDILCRNKQEKFRLSPLYMALVAFCFSMTVGVVWEFIEYGIDMVLHTDMQKDTVVNAIYSVALDPDHSNTVYAVENIRQVLMDGRSLPMTGYLDIGLHDTMEDLLVNFVGAVVFSVIGFFYITYRGKGKLGRLAAQFIPQLREPKTPPEEN